MKANQSSLALAADVVRTTLRGAGYGAVASSGLLLLGKVYGAVRGKNDDHEEGFFTREDVEGIVRFSIFAGSMPGAFRLLEGILRRAGIASQSLRFFLSGLGSGSALLALPESSMRSYATLYLTLQALGAWWSHAAASGRVPHGQWGPVSLACFSTAVIQYTYVYEPHLFNPSYYRVVHKLSSQPLVDQVVYHLRGVHAVVTQFPFISLREWLSQLEKAKEVAEWEGDDLTDVTNSLEVVIDAWLKYGNELEQGTEGEPEERKKVQAAIQELQQWERGRALVRRKRLQEEAFHSCQLVHGATSPLVHLSQWAKMVVNLMSKSAKLYLSVHCLPVLLTAWKRSPSKSLEQLFGKALPKAMRSIAFTGTYGFMFCLGLCGGRSILKKDTKLQLIAAGFCCGIGLLWEASSRRGEVVCYLLTQVLFVLWRRGTREGQLGASEKFRFSDSPDPARKLKEGGLPSPTSNLGLVPLFCVTIGLMMAMLATNKRNMKPMYTTALTKLFLE